MTRKAWLCDFEEKACETLIGDNVGNGYNCLCVLFFNFEEALTSFKIENFYKIFKFTYFDNLVKELNLPKFHLREY